MEKIDIAVIGAGVVGLAVTAGLSSRFDDSTIVMFEKHESFGKETSSRNSEVIHSGLYYPAGSLKASLCVEGRKLLYEFCEKWKVPHDRTGKLIVARSTEEITELESLLKKGCENGIFDLDMLDKSGTHKLEPEIKAEASIFSPSTGIVDSHILMSKLEGMAKQNYALLAYGHEVTDIETAEGGYQVAYRTVDGSEDKLECRFLVNCAGLFSDRIAGMMGIGVDEAGYRLFPCKGEYFSIRNAKSKLVSHLIYPPPHRNLEGLGIHVTKSLDGGIRLGPNSFYIDKLDYSVGNEHAEMFYNAAKKYLPFIELDDIEPDMAGIRPKIQGPGEPVKDFVIRHEADRGLPGVINLVGIESPGLTSCLAIAGRVTDMIAQINS